MNKKLLETYTDYLISSFSYTTATGLSILDGLLVKKINNLEAIIN